MKKSNRKTKINGTVYCFTNEVNGHKYIGITKNKLKTRLDNHYGLIASGAPLLVKALKKYGKEKIKANIIDTASTLEELHDKEIYWIKKLNTKAPKGYNILPGGLNNEAAVEANKEPVKCLTNNKTYDSITQASEYTGVSSHLIGFNCRGRQDTAGGMVFVYLNKKKRTEAEKIKNNRKKNRDKKIIKIKNLSTGEIYLSLAEAERKTGISRNVVSMCALGKMDSSKGIRFEYIDNNKKKLAKQNKMIRMNSKESLRKSKTQILLVTTGQIFYGILEASRATNVHQSAIRAVCNGINDKANGLIFEYINEKLKEKAKKNRIKRKKKRDKLAIKNAKLMSKTMSKPVLCVELNRLFKSITEATKLTGIGEGAINRSLKSKTPCRAGMTFIRIQKGETV